jgi:hypothetical protein
MLLLSRGSRPAADTPRQSRCYLGAALIDSSPAGVRPAWRSSRGSGQRTVPAGEFAQPDSRSSWRPLHRPDSSTTHPDAVPPVAKAHLRRELYSGVTTVRDMAGCALVVETQTRGRIRGSLSPDIFYAALMAGPQFRGPRTTTRHAGRCRSVPWMLAVTAETTCPGSCRARGTELAR